MGKDRETPLTNKSKAKHKDDCWQELLKKTFLYDGDDILKKILSANQDYDEDTLNALHRVQALGRVYNALRCGTLLINGQKPDEGYNLGEYFVRGGRICFDLSALSRTQQSQFWQYLFPENQVLQKRTFSTHSAGGYDANGNLAEDKGQMAHSSNKCNLLKFCQLN